jgi:sugar/nucleoside kinase (ribokinase family)
MKYAKEGKTIDEAYDAVVEYADRTFGFVNFVSSPTVRKLLSWRPGLFPEGFQVKDGSYTAFGIPTKVRDGDEIVPVAARAGKLMNVIGSGDSLEESMTIEAQRLKDSLQPGQKLGQILVSCVGRPDYGHNFLDKLRKLGVEIDGTPHVYNAAFLSLAMSSWGEVTFLYRIIE